MEWGDDLQVFKSCHISPTTPGVALPQSAHTVASRRFSLQFTPTSPTFSNFSASRTTLCLGKERDEDEEAFEKEKEVVTMSGSRAAGSREKRVRKRWDDAKISALTSVKVDSKNNVPFLGDDDQFHAPGF
jgi:ATP-binding cassette subfamily B (MDR/TAP) protein 1